MSKSHLCCWFNNCLIEYSDFWKQWAGNDNFHIFHPFLSIQNTLLSTITHHDATLHQPYRFELMAFLHQAVRITILSTLPWNHSWNVWHYLFECSYYTHKCHILKCKLGRKSRDMSYILSCLNATMPLPHYINSTGCLKSTFGVVISEG